MGTYTGTNGNDTISRGYVLSAGVVSVPAGSSPSDESDTLMGLAGNDYLEGEGGNDTLQGGTGDDNLYGDTGDDRLYGDEGNDWLRGEDGNDTLNGGVGDDPSVSGGAGDDKLYGDNGKDYVLGDSGNDMLKGGAGQDRLEGGTGNDIFVFDTVSDSAVGDIRDVIEDFRVGEDKIDVSAIDANADVAGHQAFELLGTALPAGPGQITLSDATNGETIIQLNTTGDLNPESEIAIDDGYSVSASSYKASDFILARPSILQNGSFEEGPDPGAYLTLNPGSKDITGWEVIRGGIDYFGTGWVASDGNRSLDLNGTPGVGGVAQTFPTTPGHKYQVSFDMAGHNSGLLQKMTVSAAGQSADFSFQSGTDPNNLGWKGQTWDFNATAPQTTLEFYSQQTAYEYGGPALDHVVVAEADLLLA